MNNKDWVGNSKSIYMTLGASNHTDMITRETSSQIPLTNMRKIL